MIGGGGGGGGVAALRVCAMGRSFVKFTLLQSILSLCSPEGGVSE